MLQYAMLMLMLLAPQDRPATITRPQAAPTPPATAAPTDEAAALAAPNYATGPLKAEIAAIREVRTIYIDNAEQSARETNFAVRVRVSGAEIAEVSRYSDLVLEELVDNTGHDMIDPNTVPTVVIPTRVNRVPAEQLAKTGLILDARAGASARGATSIAHAKGYVRMIIGYDSHPVTIVNPVQYYNKTIDDPYLKSLGVEAKIVPASEVEQPLAPQRTLVLTFPQKGELIGEIELFDGNMRPVQYRPISVATRDGQPATALLMGPEALTNELQIVLNVYSKVQDLRAELDAKDVPLP